jgi:signal transduction histidine kinase
MPSQSADMHHPPALVTREEVDRLLAQSNASFHVSLHQMLAFAEQARSLADSIGYTDAETEAYRKIGIVYAYQSRFKEAWDIAREVMTRAECSGNSVALGNAFHFFGMIESREGDKSVAIRYYEKSLDFFLQAGDMPRLNSAKINIGNLLFQIGRPNDALSCFNEPLRFYREVGDELQISGLLVNIGACQVSLGEYKQGLATYEDAYRILDRLELHRTKSDLLNNIALVHEELGNLEDALTHHHHALTLRQQEGLTDGVAASLNNIGNIHGKLKDYDKALEFYLKSAAMYETHSNPNIESIAWHNVADTLISKQQYAEALHYAKKSIQMLDEHSEPGSRVLALHSMGEALCKTGNAESGLVYLNDSLALAETIEDRYLIIILLYQIGSAHFSLGSPTPALEFLLRAKALAEASAMEGQLTTIYQLLADVYAAMQDFAQAFHFHKEFYRVNTKIFNEETSTTIRRLSIQFETEKREKEAELYRLKNETLTETNAALQEANRLKNELLSIAAHDLKNPLQTIISYSQLIREEPSLNEIKTMSVSIEKGANHMFRLITAMLETAALESGNLVLERQCINLSELVKDVLAAAAQLFAAKSIVVQFDAPPQCELSGDPTHLYNMIDNLISNAIKYSPKHTQVAVTIEKRDAPKTGEEVPRALLLVAVKDEGQGLTEKDKEHLFGKFQRLSAKPTGGETSTGLGLSIVKQIAELHSGRVWAESEGKNKGATFFVELPV